MRLLLDTHVWLWFALDPGRVSADVQALLGSVDTEIYVSVASLWEVVIKTSLGKLDLPDPPETFWECQTRGSGMATLPIRPEHILDIAVLPHIHRDPFDRLLVAQARVERLTLVTTDPKIRAYPVATLSAESS
ncbi:twitching motility protein PilT [Sorangium cellulosum]|uniref:Twitching motility protein PilT n=1 Tax=Sorangium cellulosum TaxID=56 RepID=A0A2L0F4P3_SORCE|nr:type II toxin-antitoxin system VapC family toxin [Sorangium cellulosum]AUX46497.1 twitching motility protein PilT [Sorangium cellulosum]